ncbi:unnamed protein product [Protopolystoma xenopodis]|uniref:Laminin EGF-like domain-containing protein n=1 Tax=Protopolystoma xenopodis TaxID=117903 RepID=A0A448WA02_9PLAT|nr:unnamed protein product [Protopolystoma xenopodis]
MDSSGTLEFFSQVNSHNYKAILLCYSTDLFEAKSKACQCNDNSQLCDFDESLYRTTGSGSRCIACGNNTVGTHCELCLEGHYMNPQRPTTCLHCDCDPTGTVGSSQTCDSDGQCACKPGVGGRKCDRCLDDNYGFSAAGCQPCNCFPGGSLENRAQCDSKTGQCLCKDNVVGKTCSECVL